MIALLGKTLSEIYKIVEELQFPKYTAKQITDWLYKKDISSIDEMIIEDEMIAFLKY